MLIILNLNFIYYLNHALILISKCILSNIIIINQFEIVNFRFIIKEHFYSSVFQQIEFLIICIFIIKFLLPKIIIYSFNFIHLITILALNIII